MTHYYKLAFITFKIIGSLITFYSLLSFGYVLLNVRYDRIAAAGLSGGTIETSTGAVVAKFLPVFFYLLLGLLIFVLSKQLAKLSVKGIERE